MSPEMWNHFTPQNITVWLDRGFISIEPAALTTALVILLSALLLIGVAQAWIVVAFLAWQQRRRWRQITTKLPKARQLDKEVAAVGNAWPRYIKPDEPVSKWQCGATWRYEGRTGSSCTWPKCADDCKGRSGAKNLAKPIHTRRKKPVAPQAGDIVGAVSASYDLAVENLKQANYSVVREKISREYKARPKS